MPSIFDKIFYERKLYHDSGPFGKQAIEKLVDELYDIRVEITNDPNGMIAIMPSGNILPMLFSPELARKISDIVAGLCRPSQS